jgi:16S rRNA C1402 (ribose-2'-O) methylase RsmI
VKNIDDSITVSAVRDMTKKREKSYFGNVDKVIDNLKKDGIEDNPHGEWVILLSKKV